MQATSPTSSEETSLLEERVQAGDVDEASTRSSDTASSDDRNATALSSIPFGERASAVADGSLLSRSSGLQKYRRGNKRKSNDVHVQPKRRKDRHAPVEERISKKPVSCIRDSVQRKGARHVDPRFIPESHGGENSSDGVARRRFSFLYKEHIPFEIQELKGQLRKSQDVADRRRLQIRLSKLQQALKKHEDQELADEVDREWRGEERAATERGKKKFYLKASDKKRLVLAKKFERLEAAGKFEKYAEKKRKKNASRDHKKLPFPAK